MRWSVALSVFSIWMLQGCQQADAGRLDLATEPVRVATLNDTVLATGRVHAAISVDVSSQLSGRIETVLVDFNDTVSAGQPLARLDQQRFVSRVEELRAALAVAEAELVSAEAALTGVRARADEDAREYQRKNDLRRQGSVSESEVSRALAVKLQSESTLATHTAAREIKAANILAAQASLRQAEIDLERTVIRAPIPGVVMKRSIEPGQTVAVSLSAPELFTIADDLASVEVHAQIDEADIGRVRAGQRVAFTIDAYPSRTFSGTVAQTRKSPEITQGVVSYTVVIRAENPEALMLPGMTALVEIITSRRDDVLQIPNAALRFNMPFDALQAQPIDDSAQPAVWVRGDGGYDRRAVEVGYSNGEFSEVRAESLAPGEQVVVGFRR